MDFDVFIRNGRVIDGAGNPWFEGDVGIKDGKIEKVGYIPNAQANRVIDAAGLVISPGFINTHSHSDLSMLINPRFESKVRQGITTEIGGLCGYSAAPVTKESFEDLKAIFVVGAAFFHLLWKETKWGWSSFEEYMQRLERDKFAINFGSYVGHFNARVAVIGNVNRTATYSEIEKMKMYVTEAMEHGALGFTSGLSLTSAASDEIAELAKVAAQYGGHYNEHQRAFGAKILDATRETLDIVEKANVRTVISHHMPLADSREEDFELLRQAREKGLQITFDHWFCRFGGASGLLAFFPRWFTEGSFPEMMDRLKNHSLRERVKKEIVDSGKWFGHASVLKQLEIRNIQKNNDLVGKNITEAAEVRGQDVIDTVCDLLLEEDPYYSVFTKSPPIIVTKEENILATLPHPLAAVADDNPSLAPYGPLSFIRDERAYGAFAEILGSYVRDKKVITLEDAIRRMTSFPAQVLGIRDRGLLREGMWADITIFDYNRIRNRASPTDPTRYAEGVEYVLVNGQVIIDRGEHTGALPGRIIRHSAS